MGSAVVGVVTDRASHAAGFVVAGAAAGLACLVFLASERRREALRR